MKAVIIARVSTEEQKEAGNSLPAQIIRLEKYCQNKGFEIIRTCSFDESAYTNDRTEFDRIIDFILDQKEKVVVCCDKVDRLSRNVFDKRIQLLYEKALSDDIELHFASEGQIINSRISAVQKFQFSMSLGLAKYYSDAISENVKRSQEQKIRKGEWLSKAPYGYTNITKPDGSGDIVVDQYGALVIKKAYELYATGAYSLGTLCQKLDHDYNVKWPKGSLGKILKNPFYHGTMIIKKKSYPHRYPPLISQVLFENVQKIKEGFQKKPFKYAGINYLYRGLLRCGECGRAITPEKQKGYIYYHCTQSKGKHDAPWFREEEITEQLGQVFKLMQVPADILDQIIQTLNEVHLGKVEFHTKQFDMLTKEHKSVTTMLDNLYFDKLKGKITDEHYDRFYESLRIKRDDVSIRLSRLEAAEDNYYVTARYILELASRAYDLFTSSEVAERRQLVKLVLQNVCVKDEKIVYDALKPFDLFIKAGDGQLWRG